MTNLLPEPEQHSIRRERRLRFVAVALVGTALVLFSGTAVLGPLLVGVWGRERAQADLLTFTNRTPQTAGDEISPEQVKTALAAANNEIAVFADVLLPSSVGGLVERLVSLSGEDISLRGLLYTAAKTKAKDAEPWTMQIRGSARTRESLTTFERKLEMDPSVARADIPLENFAPDRNIDFSVTIIGALSEDH
jgi:hypothetical protein